MLIHALSGAACSRLFSRYPLAVTAHSADSGYRSMVLMNRASWTWPAGDSATCQT